MTSAPRREHRAAGSRLGQALDNRHVAGRYSPSGHMTVLLVAAGRPPSAYAGGRASRCSGRRESRMMATTRPGGRLRRSLCLIWTTASSLERGGGIRGIVVCMRQESERRTSNAESRRERRYQPGDWLVSGYQHLSQPKNSAGICHAGPAGHGVGSGYRERCAQRIDSQYQWP
jgi:hypothetical protein